MEIISPSFLVDEDIPKRYACDGENLNPPLEFFDVPTGAADLVVVMYDPGASSGTFYHWLVWNINPDFEGIAEGQEPLGSKLGQNSAGKSEYTGPCPPAERHRYFFELYALSEKLKTPAGSDVETLKRSMEGKILEKAELMGYYQRSG